MAYEVEFSPEAEEELEFLTDYQLGRLEDEIDRKLRHQPLVRTKNRFPMKPNAKALWELRADPLRVYYDVVGITVRIKGVGIKDGNKLRIGGRLIDLSEYLNG